MSNKLHITDTYDVTLCGVAIVDDNTPEWTDDLIITEDPTWTADLCPTCRKAGAKLWARITRRSPAEEQEWAREIAREEGMLGGVDAYNDWQGY